MSHKDEGLKTRHRQYWKKIEADSVVLDPGIIAISWEDSTIRLHDGYTIGGRIFSMLPAPSLTVNVLTPLSGNGSVSSPISLNIAALANQVPVLANAPLTGTGVSGNPLGINEAALALALTNMVGVAHDPSLVGNGTAGAPLSVNWGLAPAQPVVHNGTLSGNGTSASPLGVTNATGAARGVVQLATAAEGLQPANDIDATTPAYIAAAIAAIPGEKFLQGLQSYNAATNVMTLLMNDGSTVPVDLTSLVADAVAEVPNKHVGASLASPSGSIAITATGTDAQTFTVETNAGLISIVDAAGRFTATTVEGAFAEISDPATLAEMTQGGTPTQKFVQADELVSLIATTQNRYLSVYSDVAPAVYARGDGAQSGGQFDKTVGAGIAANVNNTSAANGHALVATRNAGIGDAIQAYKQGAEYGNALYAAFASTGNGSALYGSHTGASGDAAYILRSGSGIGHGLQVLNGTTGAGDYGGILGFRTGTGNGDAGDFYRLGAGAGNALIAYRSGSGVGVALSAQNYSTGAGGVEAAYFLRDGGAGDTIKAWRDDSTGAGTGAVIDCVNYAANGVGANFYSQSGNGIVAHAEANTKSAGYFGHFSASVAVELATLNGALGGSGGWSVYAVGPVFSAGGYTTSDKRVKDNVRPIENALDRIAKLDAITHTWRADTIFAKNAPGVHFGLLAQQVEDVFPEVVSRTSYPCGPVPEMGPIASVETVDKPIPPPDGAVTEDELASYKDALAAYQVSRKRAERADKRNEVVRARHAEAVAMHSEQKAIADELGEMLAIDYAKLVPVLIAAINVLRARVEALEAR